jgi:hypothetical protein
MAPSTTPGSMDAPPGLPEARADGWQRSPLAFLAAMALCGLGLASAGTTLVRVVNGQSLFAPASPSPTTDAAIRPPETAQSEAEPPRAVAAAEPLPVPSLGSVRRRLGPPRRYPCRAKLRADPRRRRQAWAARARTAASGSRPMLLARRGPRRGRKPRSRARKLPSRAGRSRGRKPPSRVGRSRARKPRSRAGNPRSRAPKPLSNVGRSRPDGPRSSDPSRPDRRSHRRLRERERRARARATREPIESRADRPRRAAGTRTASSARAACAGLRRRSARRPACEPTRRRRPTVEWIRPGLGSSR